MSVLHARPHGYHLSVCPHGCVWCEVGWGNVPACDLIYRALAIYPVILIHSLITLTSTLAVVYSYIFLSVYSIGVYLVACFSSFVPVDIGGADDMYVENTQLHVNVGGGRGVHLFVSHDVLRPYMSIDDTVTVLPDLAPSVRYRYHGHIPKTTMAASNEELIAVAVPIGEIASSITIHKLHDLIRLHDTEITSRCSKQYMVSALQAHRCSVCDTHVSLFKCIPIFDKHSSTPSTIKHRVASLPKSKSSRIPVAVSSDDPDTLSSSSPFPPSALASAREASIVRSCTDAMQPSVFQEAGCTVCGQLKPLTQLSAARHVAQFFTILKNNDGTWKERFRDSDLIAPLAGPVLDPTTDLICLPCRASVHKSVVPKHALARNLWLGEVPEVLSCLSFVERILVSRVHHSCCFVCVALLAHPDLGSRKMISHVVAFEAPVSKVYSVLPPPKEELDEVLAVIFTGPSAPTEADLKRTPLLVCHNHIIESLAWLHLNHCDYQDVEVSVENLATYEDGKAPVAMLYKNGLSNKVPEGTSVFDNEEADGTTDGPCPVVVHGLVGEQLDTLTIKAQKTMAAHHFKANRGVLAVGHAEAPESIYNNLTLYPSMFLWLFPYGLGGIGATGLSDKAHKKWLLMYHDKRFQTDIAFPFVAFSHKQVRSSTTGGFLLASKDKFFDISERLLHVNEVVLESLSDRMKAGETVVPATPAEKDCFQLINNLDHITYKVQGSLTTKKYMQNEAYSLMAAEGAPSWYFTMAPSDHSHPICVYWVGNKVEFDPVPLQEHDRVRSVTSNPVAAARFFNFMVQLFITHVLRPGDATLSGLFGDTSAYYGMVEQQGRLTLHIHMIIWLCNSLSPQQVKERLLAGDSVFQQELIAYLESVHKGDYLTGAQVTVSKMRHADTLQPGYVDHTEVLPVTPPAHCSTDDCKDCAKGDSTDTWWSYYRRIVDTIVNKCNVHSCHSNTWPDGMLKGNANAKGCKDNRWKQCKARFPHKIVVESNVDDTGHINLKKSEAWINTFVPLISYLFRCNTDITLLRSGTAIKAVLIYVTDYITKPGLKTHAIFDCIRSIFQRSREHLDDPQRSRKDRARKLMTQMVNILGAKTELGSPMICTYLLGLPDHYTNRQFATFYWKSFVTEARNFWLADGERPNDVKITLKRGNRNIVGVSPVEDYIHRPSKLEGMSLYDWIGLCECVSNKSANSTSKGDLGEDPIELDAVEEELNERGDQCDDKPSNLSDDDDADSLDGFIIPLSHEGSPSPGHDERISIDGAP